MSGSMKIEGDTKSTDKETIDRLARGGNRILVYSHSDDKAVWCSKENLSALVVTKTGGVFGAGLNCLVVGNRVTDNPMEEGGDRHLQDYVKVNRLSDMNIKKIVVGCGFGVALTCSNELMMWKSNSVVPKDVVEFPSYDASRKCGCNKEFTRVTFVNVELSYCSTCNKYPEVITSGGKVSPKKLIRYGGSTVTLPCYKCLKPCSCITLNNINLQYCSPCNLMLEQDKMQEGTAKSKFENPFKVMIANDEKLIDIACCGIYVCLLFESDKLVLKSYDTGVECNEHLNQNQNPSKKVAVYGGGENCLFVKSEEGGLLKVESSLSTRKITLSRIKVPAAVKKVCCGSTTAAALLVDGSVWFIADDLKTYRLNHNSGISTFSDIAVAAMTDVFLVQAHEASVMQMSAFLGDTHIEVRFYDSVLDSALLEMVNPQPFTPPNTPLPPNLVKLYGKSHLADLTFKLSIGEFPAHSCVLFSTSAHFHEVFTATKATPKVLDVSGYNPKAYKCLLQYFYQVKPDDLDAEDLLDLRQIATSYGESAIAEDVKTKIKAKINEENVLQIFIRSRQFDFKDVVKECEKIMHSPTFLEKFINAAIQTRPI